MTRGSNNPKQVFQESKVYKRKNSTLQIFKRHCILFNSPDPENCSYQQFLNTSCPTSQHQRHGYQRRPLVEEHSIAVGERRMAEAAHRKVVGHNSFDFLDHMRIEDTHTMNKNLNLNSIETMDSAQNCPPQNSSHPSNQFPFRDLESKQKSHFFLYQCKPQNQSNLYKSIPTRQMPKNKTNANKPRKIKIFPLLMHKSEK